MNLQLSLNFDGFWRVEISAWIKTLVMYSDEEHSVTHAQCNMIWVLVIFMITASSVRADVLTDDITCKIIPLFSAPFNKLRCDLSGDVPPGTVKSLTWSWKAKHVETKTCNVTSFVPELCELLLFNTSVSQVNCTISASNSRATCGVNYVAPTVSVNITLRPMPIIGGETVVFRCTADGWPRPTITWFKDGAQIKGDDKLNEMRLITQKTVNKIEQVVDLKVWNVTKKHKGKYECIATNIAGKKGTEYSTYVSCPYEFSRCEIRRTSPMVLIAQKGENVTLSCSAIYPDYCDDPVWEPNVNGYQEMFADEFDCYRTLMTRTIYNVSEVDTGMYTCSIICVDEAETLKTIKNSSISVLLKSQRPFYRLLAGQETVSALPGSDVYLKCEVKCLKFLLIHVRTFWRFNGTTIKTDDHRHELSWHFGLDGRTMFSLKIRNVSPYDSGLYSCGMNESITAETLLKNISLMVTPEPPQRNDSPEGNATHTIILLLILLSCTGTVGFAALVLYQIFKRWKARKSYSWQIEMEEFKSDVFVTYSSKDFKWVDEELIPVLEENHVNYIIHCRDFELGKPIVENMAESIYTSRKIIVILSRNYIASRFCLEELEMALRRNKVGIDTPIVAIRLEKLKRNEIPKGLRRITFLDYADKEERQFWKERLTKKLTACQMKGTLNEFDTWI